MARKSPSEGDPTPFAETVKESAQQVWLAGLGAFSKAQEEGGKVFEALVKEGAATQLGSLFEERLARGLQHLGVPTARDLEALAQRVAELERMVARLRQDDGDPAP